jgi:hypothetical protein
VARLFPLFGFFVCRTTDLSWQQKSGFYDQYPKKRQKKPKIEEKQPFCCGKPLKFYPKKGFNCVNLSKNYIAKPHCYTIQPKNIHGVEKYYTTTRLLGVFRIFYKLIFLTGIDLPFFNFYRF